MKKMRSKQKISAIVLLISFVGILAHDIIPHHHHENFETSEVHFGTNEHEHEHDHQHQHKHHHSNELEGNPGESHFKHSHNHCHHQVESCVLSYYESSRAGNQHQNKDRHYIAEIPKHLYSSGIILDESKQKYIDHPPEEYRNKYLQNIQRRGPPAKA